MSRIEPRFFRPKPCMPLGSWKTHTTCSWTFSSVFRGVTKPQAKLYLIFVSYCAKSGCQLGGQSAGPTI